MQCPKCGSRRIIKNGSTRHKKQKYQCNECHRQFVENPKSRTIPPYKIEIIDKLLLERISLAGIARAVGVSIRWLQNYVNNKFKQIQQEVQIPVKEKGRLIIEADEMHTYIGNKRNVQWLWLAQDAETREIVGVYLGNRDAQSALALWKSLPPVYRQCAVCYTDGLDSYATVFPKSRHRSTKKGSGKTNHIERLNNTFRQRLSRLARKTLSFSKKLTNHLGAIWNFVHHYNANLHLMPSS
jgi:IS1 family transposase/transposase-like protein